MDPTDEAPPRAALDVYRKKRDFRASPEPRVSGGARARKKVAKEGWSYVVHKHAARNLHYDFRLELGGVLLSWAVPKGPPSVPGKKALAVRTEDHPLEYGAFEGVIPPGAYGAGTVEIWDCGRWQPEGDARRGIEEGRLLFRLEGGRLEGPWTLVRMRSSRTRRGEEREWLLMRRAEGAERPREGSTEPSAARVTSKKQRAVQQAEPRSRRRVAPTSGHAPEDDSDAALVAGVRLTHPERVLYPEQGLTKRELAEYYAAVAELILPHVADRPLTLLRCPRGRSQACFFQKHFGEGLPPSVRAIRLQEKKGGSADYVGVDDLAGLLALVQLSALELHPWGSRADRLDRPDRLVIDLDPGPGVAWERVVAAAQRLRELTAELGLEAFARTTGGKGVHVVLPIARRSTWAEAKEFTHDLAAALVRADARGYVLTSSKARRAGKIFVDTLRNDRGATAVASYSARARPGAPVATPLAWSELTDDLDPLSLTVRTVPGRVASKRADPWRGFLELQQSLTRLARAGARKL